MVTYNLSNGGSLWFKTHLKSKAYARQNQAAVVKRLVSYSTSSKYLVSRLFSRVHALHWRFTVISIKYKILTWYEVCYSTS